jgi:small subunit ribosomal protein S17
MEASSATVRGKNRKVGIVVKDRMQKTVVVAVERFVRHDLYRKRIKRTSTFMAHDELGAKAGDTVRIVESRPLSRNKRWVVEAIVQRASAYAEAAAVGAGAQEG